MLVDIQTAVWKDDEKREMVITARIDDAEFTFMTDENPKTVDEAVKLAVKVYKEKYIEEIMGEKEVGL